MIGELFQCQIFFYCALERVCVGLLDAFFIDFTISCVIIIYNLGFSFPAVPKSEPAALLFLTQSEFLTEIRSVSLDGSTKMDRSFKITVRNTHFAIFFRISMKNSPTCSCSTRFAQLNTQILEMWHANRSVCLVSGTHEIGTLNLTCYSIDNFSISWSFPKPEIFSGLKSKSKNNRE